MREIKFKYTYSDGHTSFDRVFTLDQIEGGCQFDEISDSPLLRDFKIVNRRQFTGESDINNIEIYEGDLMLDGHSGGYGVVRFYRGAFIVEFDGEIQDLYDWTCECIIGRG